MTSSVRHEGQPNLLFVTYAFPPARPIGAVRTWNIAKHLARSGWAVTVLTPAPSLWRDADGLEATTSNLDREKIRRLPTDHGWRWLAADRVRSSNHTIAWLIGGLCRRMTQRLGVDRTVGWIAPASEVAATLTTRDVDIVLASGPPFSAFPLAVSVAERLGRPLVLDYRDLWSHHLHSQVPRAIRQESAVLTRAAAVTTVSPSWAGVLGREFGIGEKVYVVSNGYDSEDLARVVPHDFGHFAIVYTGSLWPPKRVVSPVMAALRRIKERERNGAQGWRFHYYGKHQSHVLGEAERFGVIDRVVVHGNVARAAALSAVKGAGVSVVITSVVDEEARPEDNGMVTGKIFEAIGLGIPTLLVAPAGSDANVVAETTGLARRCAANDIDGIAAFLEAMMDGDCLHPKDPAAYAWENLVAGLDKILRRAMMAARDSENWSE